MRRLIIIAAALGAFAAIGCQPPASNTANSNANKPANGANNANTASTANAEAEVKKAMDDMAAAMAKNDADAIGALLADDYVLITPRGTTQTKAERMAAVKSGNTKFDSFTYEDVKVRPFGNTAVATATVRAKGKAEGQDVPPQVKATIVFVKTGNEWKAVSGQVTAVMEGKPGEKPANSNTSNANTGNTNAAKASPSPANK